MRYCACGCGSVLPRREYGHASFIHGHNARERVGERNPNWTGESGSYIALHKYLNKHNPKAGVCEECGEEVATDYAFKHHPEKHTRDREDYRELCRPCHAVFDGRGPGTRKTLRKTTTLVKETE